MITSPQEPSHRSRARLSVGLFARFLAGIVVLACAPIHPAAGGEKVIAGFSADPAHTGTAETRIGTRPRLLWETDVGIQGYYNSPVVVGNTLLVSSYGSIWNEPDDRDGVYVLRRTDGSIVLHLATPCDVNGISTDGKRIFAALDDGTVRAWDLASGRDLWQANPYARSITPVDQLTPAEAYQRGFDDGYIKGYVDALKATGNDDAAAEAVVKPRLYGAPLVLPEGLLVAGAGGLIRLLDPTDGHQLHGMEARGKVRNHSAGDGLVAVCNSVGEIEVFSMAGQLRYRWCAEGEDGCDDSMAIYPGNWMYAAPAIHRGHIAIAGTYYSERQFSLIDAEDGRTVWSLSSTSEGRMFGGSKASPAITDKLVLFADTVYGEDGRLMAISLASGQRLWLVEGYGGSWGSPVVVGDKAVWVTVPGTLLIVNLNNGKVQAKVELEDTIYASPAVADGVIYVGGDSGQVYAIDTGYRR